MRRARTLEETAFVQAFQKSSDLRRRDRRATQAQRRRDALDGTLAVEQHQDLGRAVGDRDGLHVGVRRIAQHERALAAIVNRKNLDRPQPRVLIQWERAS